MRMPFALVCAISTLLCSTLLHAAPDKIYWNAQIWTGGDARHTAEALAVDGERITAVGASAQIKTLADNHTQQIDLHGAFVSPGFIDAHVHFIEGGFALGRIDLRDAATPKAFADRIAAAAKAKPGEWILDGAWDHELWGGELPDRKWIDARTPDTPVYVTRLDGHMALANAVALKLAGIDDKTPDPPGGTIVRDRDGRATGVLKDNAQELMSRRIPADTEAQIDEALKRATDHALRAGVTQVHDMAMGTWRSLEAYRRADARKALRLRIYSFVPLTDWKRMADYVAANGRGSDRLRWGALKGYVDGSLGSKTAWFHEPYTDDVHSSGLIRTPPDILLNAVQQADRAGLHVVVHAIGDRANDWMLDTYKQVAAENGPRDRRFRIEHAQHLSAAALPRFAGQNVIASMQPYHAIDDGRWAEKRIGAQRLAGAYAFHSLLDAKAALAFGSDWPVAPMEPLTGIYAAATRRTIDGANPQGWQPAQKISIEQAMRAYTQTNAFAGYQEKSAGRLAPGYLADFVVISGNVFNTKPVAIADLKVLRTVVGGEDAFVR